MVLVFNILKNKLKNKVAFYATKSMTLCLMYTVTVSLHLKLDVM